MDSTNENLNRNNSNDMGLESPDTIGDDSEKLDNLGKKLARDEKGRLLPNQPSLNPKGRPKGQTLKEWRRQKLMEMTDEERLDFLKTISNSEQWRMAEGNPKQDVEANIKGELKIEISEDIAKKYDTPQNSEGNSSE